MARVNVTFTDDEMDHIEKASKKLGISNSEYVRKLYFEGKNLYSTSENLDLILKLLDERLRSILMPQIERLASLSAKSGIMAATSTFLNAQCLKDCTNWDMKDSYAKARAKGIEYMKSNATDYKEKL